MNKIIKEQLSKVKSTKIDFTDNDLKIIIPKTTAVIKQALEVGKVYQIKVGDKEYISELLSVDGSGYKWNGVSTVNSLDNLYGIYNDFEIMSKL